MNLTPTKLLRIQLLSRIVRKEIRHLCQTDQRLFTTPFTRTQAQRLEADAELAERVDAFVARLGRLQDTVGDKLLPHYLNAVGERTATAADNLNRAEKLALITSAETWMVLRDLRNQMIHEYIEDLDHLAEALNRGHQLVETISSDAERILADCVVRGWIVDMTP